jgi:transposase
LTFSAFMGYLARMQTQQAILLSATEATASTIHINGKCNYREEGEMKVVFANGIPLFHYAKADKAADHYAMVHLVETGLASQQEVSAAFECSRLTVLRAKKKFDEGGVAALVPKKTGPRDGSKINKAKARQILVLKNRGLSNVAVGVKLGLKEDAVRKALKRMGWQAKAAQQVALPVEPESSCPTEAVLEQDSRGVQAACAVEDPDISPPTDTAEAEEAIESYDIDPSNRAIDRACARLGFLEDAAPLFRDAENVSGVGVLAAIPAIVESGVLETARKVYGSVGASFYGLRTVVLTLVLMALLRIKRAESLKEWSPVDLGRLLGLDRACEMKTLRRKLGCLAVKNKAEVFGQELAKTRLERREAALGFLYLDGHVRVYHGKRQLSKAYVTQRRLAMPATTDYWINDQEGQPILVITAPANEGLVKMLEPLVEEIKGLMGEERRLCIVFDRGGWSPNLFQKLMRDGVDIVTYRKGKIDLIPEEFFLPMAEELAGRRVEYKLHDRSVAFMDGKMWLRQVSRLNRPGHQTHIVTSRQDLSPVTIAYRMFERWRQENFFKYMSDEYALDALVDYGFETDDPERLVPNPERKEISRQRAKVKATREALEQEYGFNALNNEEALRPSMRGFKIANSALGRKIEALRKKETELKNHCRQVPERVPLKAALGANASPHRLKREKKRLTDLLKIVAYQVESDLLGLIRSDYARSDDEGRTLVQSILSGSGDLKVNGNELRISLNPLSAPHRSKVAGILCEKLNSMNCVFPGTKGLNLVYCVKQHGDVT